MLLHVALLVAMARMATTAVAMVTVVAMAMATAMATAMALAVIAMIAVVAITIPVGPRWISLPWLRLGPRKRRCVTQGQLCQRACVRRCVSR